MISFMMRGRSARILHQLVSIPFSKSKPLKHRQQPGIHQQTYISQNLYLHSYLSNSPQHSTIENQSQVPPIQPRALPTLKDLNSFSKDVDLLDRIQNSRKLTLAIACFLDENEYINLHQEIYRYVDDSTLEKSTKTQQNQLFSRVKSILFEAIEDEESVQELVRLLSESDPKLIQLEEIKRISSLKYQETQSNQPSKFDLMLSTLPKRPSKPTRIFLKKTHPKEKFIINEENKQKVERKIFKNKKSINQNIILKKVSSLTQPQKENFGQNWVYVYDLPYKFSQNEASTIIDFIKQKYGAITDHELTSYCTILEEHSEISTTYQLHDDFKKLQKIKTPSPQPTKHLKTSLTTKILQKIKKQKKVSLNKSSMVFRFASSALKQQFLTPQMRLYGLNINNFHNIKFEQAQGKKILLLHLNRWGWNSEELIEFLNDALQSLNVKFSMDSFIVMKHYVFLQFDSFYEAFHAKNLLHNLIFQEKSIKASLHYGSVRKVDGQYKIQLQFNHHDELLNKLSQARCFYNDINK